MAIENFLADYTEVDILERMTVTATKANVVIADADEDVYLYKDFTLGHFDSLNTKFESYVDSGSSFNGYGGMGFANVVSTMAGFGNTDMAVVIVESGVGTHLCYLIRGWFTAFDTSIALNLDQLYYHLIERAAGNDAIIDKIYSDAARTVLEDTLSNAGYGDEKWQYCYGFTNPNYAFAGREFTGYTQNLDLQETSPSIQDARDYASGRAYASGRTPSSGREFATGRLKTE